MKLLVVVLLTITSFGTNHSDFLEKENVVKKRVFNRQFHSNGNIKSEGWECRSQKEGYWKYYHLNGRLSAKGHFRNDNRTGYWFYYNADGSIIKEGHFKEDHAEKWWIFYEIGSQKKKKVQYKNNKKHGYGLTFNKNRLIKAEKFVNNVQTGEWTSLYQFRIDNPNVSF